MSRKAHNAIVKAGRTAALVAAVWACLVSDWKPVHGIIILAASAWLMLSVIADGR